MCGIAGFISLNQPIDHPKSHLDSALKKLNKTLKKKGKLDADDFADVKFKNKVDMTNHKPIIKKKW